MKKIFFALILLFSYINVFFAQNPKQIDDRIDSIISIMSQVKQAPNDSVRLVLGQKAALFLEQILMYPMNWKLDYSRLKKAVSVQESQDNRVKVFTWGVPYHDDMRYFGFVLYYDKKSHEGYFFQLKDKSDKIKHPEQKYLTPDQWYGCVYYDIRTFKYRRRRVYVLLGADPDGKLLNRKIIEFLTIRRPGLPRFGYPVRDEFGHPVKRFIFEYNNQASMLLTWNKDLKMIIFDHLSPSKPKFKGLHQFYGPDFSYDGLKFVKGKFIYKMDLDVRDKNLK